MPEPPDRVEARPEPEPDVRRVDAAAVAEVPASGPGAGDGGVEGAANLAAKDGAADPAGDGAIDGAPDVAVAEDPRDAGGRRDAGEAIEATRREDAGVTAPRIEGGPAVDPGVLLVEGPTGLRDPDFRIRGAARRAMRSRVVPCADGAPRTVRIQVRFEGATGRVTEFRLFGAGLQGTPFAACVERAARSVQLPTFTQRAWETDYAIPMR